MESIFERKFLKIYIAFYKPTRGKWRMDLFSNRIRFNFENRLSRATIPFTLKTSGRSCVRKWRVSSKRAIVSSPKVLAKETSIYALITVPWIYFKCFPLISPRSIYLNSKRTLSQFRALIRTKLQFFQESIVSQFPEETQVLSDKGNQTKYRIWPESLRVMLEF